MKKTNVNLIRIIKPIAYMDVNKYTQYASYTKSNNRYYINRGSAGGLSISSKNVIVLAEGVML